MQTNSFYFTPVSKVRRNWVCLKKIITSTILHQQVHQFGGVGEGKEGEDRTPGINMCDEAERMLIRQTSQNKKDSTP